MVASSFGRAVGLVQGHSAMQIANPARSVKAGMHLSKSTYQRSTPRTICFCSEIAPGGQALVQDLASLAEFVGAEGISRRRDQRHIRGHARQTDARAELSADHGPMFP